jgi:enoyl-CoA hydratase/carnithine racemase
MNEFQSVGQGAVHMNITDGIAHLSLANPSKRNALSPAMMSQLTVKLEQLHIECQKADSKLYGMIFSGSDKTFCSGFDLDSASTDYASPAKGDQMSALMHHNFHLFYTLPLISVCAIEGVISLIHFKDLPLAVEQN